MYEFSLFSNLGLLLISITNIFIGILGFVVFFNNKKSVTSRAFLFFCLVTMLWGFITFFVSEFQDTNLVLWLSRSVMFMAAWQAYAIFNLFYVFPSEIISLITLSPLVFSEVIKVESGSAPVLAKGAGMIAFGFLSISLVVIGLYYFTNRISKTIKKKRLPYLLILIGGGLAFFLIILFNFILSAFFNNENFIPFGALFIVPFALLTSYSIIKHNLLNIKVISTEIFGFFLVALNLSGLIGTKSTSELIIKFTISLVLFIFTVILIRSVRNEVQQKEEVTKLAHNLEKANLRLQELDQQKTEFLSIASHQLRTPIIRGYIELIGDGAYGKVSKKLKETLKNMDESNDRLMKLVEEFLDVTRIEQGRTKFVFEDKSINDLIASVVKELSMKPEFAEKNLKIVWKPEENITNIYMDEEKIRHVVFNFLDNSIKYSDKGIIKVSVETEDGGYTVRVKDQGFGFNKEDEVNFFQKFYRGKNVEGTNVNGTGLGIYVCKRFIEKHGGHVWAHSEGLGKGSEFGFWIPGVKVEERVTGNEE